MALRSRSLSRPGASSGSAMRRGVRTRGWPMHCRRPGRKPTSASPVSSTSCRRTRIADRASPSRSSRSSRRAPSSRIASRSRGMRRAHRAKKLRASADRSRRRALDADGASQAAARQRQPGRVRSRGVAARARPARHRLCARRSGQRPRQRLRRSRGRLRATRARAHPRAHRACTACGAVRGRAGRACDRRSARDSGSAVARVQQNRHHAPRLDFRPARDGICHARRRMRAGAGATQRGADVAHSGAQGRSARRRAGRLRLRAAGGRRSSGGAHAVDARRRRVRPVARTPRHGGARLAVVPRRRAGMGPVGRSCAGILAVVRRRRFAAVRRERAPARAIATRLACARSRIDPRLGACAMGGDTRPRTGHAGALPAGVARVGAGEHDRDSGRDAGNRSARAARHRDSARRTVARRARRARRADALPRMARGIAAGGMDVACANRMDGGRRDCGHSVAARARRSTGSRAWRSVDAADGLAAAAGRSGGRRAHRRAGRRPGARGARRHRAPRARLRYRAALQRDGRRRRANRRSVPARSRHREARRAHRQSRGQRSFRRRAVDPACGSGRPADLVARRRSSDRDERTVDESPRALRGGRPLGMGRRPVRNPASCSIGLWRGGAQDQRSLVRPARRVGRRQRAADR